MIPEQLSWIDYIWEDHVELFMIVFQTCKMTNEQVFFSEHNESVLSGSWFIIFGTCFHFVQLEWKCKVIDHKSYTCKVFVGFVCYIAS